MARYDIVHDRISKGRGKAAVRVGQPFVVSRLDQTGFKVQYPTFYCLLRKMQGGPHVEQRFFISQVYELVCDVRFLRVGDILTESQNFSLAQPIVETAVEDKDTDLSLLGSVAQFHTPSYLVAQFRPVHKIIGVRMELLCQVRRGTYVTKDGGDDGVGNAAGWQQQGEASEQVLTLLPGLGVLSWADVSVQGVPISGPNANNDPFPPIPALIPFQLEIALIRGKTEHDLPMDWLKNKWHFCCPSSWPGLLLRENDVIIHPDGNRFRIDAVMESHIGPQVLQGLAEKLES